MCLPGQSGHFWTIPIPKGSIQRGKADDKLEGSWAQPTLEPSHKSRRIVMQADGARRPVQLHRGNVFGLVIFFFKTHKGGRERGGFWLANSHARQEAGIELGKKAE
jgi:hypothetical protein